MSGDAIYTQPISDTDPNYSLLACQESCRRELECQFAIVDGDGLCSLYNIGAQVVADSTGTITMWEKHCTYYGKK